MPNLYKELHERQQAEINAFPMFWAYSEKQYMEGMKKLGVENESELCYLGAGLGGGIIRKADKQNYLDMLSRHRHERADAIAEDKTGNGFIYDMFDYAQLLLDVMEALPGAKAYDNGNKYHGMYLESEDGVAMVLPVRPEPGDEVPTVLN